MQLKYEFLSKTDLRTYEKCFTLIKFKISGSWFTMKPILLILAPLILIMTGCKKLVEVKAPVTSLTSENVYTNDATAAAVLTGLYSKISSGSWASPDLTGISLKSGLSADELALFGGSTNSNPGLIAFYTNTVTTNTYQTSFWETFYNYLETINVAIEGLAKSTVLTPQVNIQLEGEAKFMRAFCYFYLANLYGDIPLAITSDYRINAALSRTPKDQVYQQIIADLKDAQTLLIDGYVGANAQSNTLERVRPNKWAATALLARVYLYTGDWANAETQATAVINKSTLYGLNTLSSAFLKNNNEAIWQLQPVNAGWNTEDAKVYILPSTGPNTGFNSYPVYLSSQLLNTFEIGDQRKVVWVGSVTVGSNTFGYPYKYKSATSGASVTEYLMVLRLAEQYLIRAEARAQLNNIGGAQSDLNTIRTRAGLPSTTASTQPTLLSAILHERQVELFTEWASRWFDLKRTNTINAVMGQVCTQKGGTWSPNWALYPLPLYDIQQNPNLTQNAGY